LQGNRGQKVGQNFPDEGCKCNGIKFRVLVEESHLIDLHDLKIECVCGKVLQAKAIKQGLNYFPTRMDKIISNLIKTNKSLQDYELPFKKSDKIV